MRFGNIGEVPDLVTRACIGIERCDGTKLAPTLFRYLAGACVEHHDFVIPNYATRINNLTSGGNNASVNSSKFTNDGNAADSLFGEGNQDWYLASNGDKLKDDQSNETVTNLA